jgi:hypothetical protein
MVLRNRIILLNQQGHEFLSQHSFICLEALPPVLGSHANPGGSNPSSIISDFFLSSTAVLIPNHSACSLPIIWMDDQNFVGDEKCSMAKLTKLLVVNVCAFIFLVVQVATGGWLLISLYGKMPLNPTLIKIHPISGLALTTFILLHMYLNRSWIKMQLSRSKRI